MHFQSKSGTPLCEKPEWGQGWSRCQNIGIGVTSRSTKDWVCIRYNTEISETNEGWLARCEVCVQGNYIAWAPDCYELEDPPISRRTTQKKGKPRAFLHSDIKDLAMGAPLVTVIRACLKAARRPITKSELIAFVGGRYREGYVSSRFVSATQELKKVFDHMVQSGEIIYEKGKPLIWRPNESNDQPGSNGEIPLPAMRG